MIEEPTWKNLISRDGFNLNLEEKKEDVSITVKETMDDASVQ